MKMSIPGFGISPPHSRSAIKMKEFSVAKDGSNATAQRRRISNKTYVFLSLMAGLVALAAGCGDPLRGLTDELTRMRLQVEATTITANANFSELLGVGKDLNKNLAKLPSDARNELVAGAAEVSGLVAKFRCARLIS